MIQPHNLHENTNTCLTTLPTPHCYKISVPKMEETKVDLQVDSHPSKIVKHSDIDVTWWRELLSHDVVMQTGMIPFSSEAGAVLFTQDVNPFALKSSSQKSIISHLSEMFAQWNGTIRFKLVLSLPMFVATKVAFAFIPSAIDPSKVSATAMVGLHNSCVINPSDSSEAVLEIPFVSETPWKAINESIGVVKAAILQPIIRTQDSSGGIPWTLFVSAKPTDFHFRYITPPSVDGGSIVAPSPSLATQVTAASISTATGPPRAANQRANASMPLIRQPEADPSQIYRSMILIPRTRVANVVDKLKPNGYPVPKVTTEIGGTNDSSNSNWKMSNPLGAMFNISAHTRKSYKLVSMPPVSSLFPWYDTGCYFYLFSNSTTTANRMPQKSAQVCLYHNALATTTTSHLFFQVTKEAFDFWAANELAFTQDLRLEFAPVVYSETKIDLVSFKFIGCRDITGQGQGYWLQFESLFAPGSLSTWPTPDGDDTYGAWAFIRPVMNFVIKSKDVDQPVIRMLEQIESAPSHVTHLALYTTMPTEEAQEFADWLISTRPTQFITNWMLHSLSFSTNQSLLAFNHGRLDDDNTRGLIWAAYKLFGGDSNAWFAWLLRGADLVLDCIVATFLGRQDASLVVDIGPDSGFYAEVDALAATSAQYPMPDSPVRLAPLKYTPHKPLRVLGDLTDDDIDNFGVLPMFGRSGEVKAAPIEPAAMGFEVIDKAELRNSPGLEPGSATVITPRGRPSGKDKKYAFPPK
uniref:Capsid protein n=1 Tax=Suncus murinus picorna-like virus 1 TaxID=3139571 RepID=A0AB38ZK95_9VIRU